MRSLFLTAGLICGAAGLAPAQVGLFPPVPGPPHTPFAELKAYLNLTDAQLKSLTDIQASRNAAQQAIYKQINDKQAQLNLLLKEGTSDALTVGQLEIDINNLRRQLPVPNDSFRASALAVLTPDQTPKLATLVQALQLQQPAWQAITLDLMNTPAPYAPPPAPAPAMRAASEAEGAGVREVADQ